MCSHLCLSPSTVGHCGPGQRSGAAETGEEGGYQIDYAIGEELLHGEERKGGWSDQQQVLHTWSPCSDTKHTYVGTSSDGTRPSSGLQTGYTSTAILSAQRGANKVQCGSVGYWSG